MSEYNYKVEEYSQDARYFTVKSNMKLPREVVRSVYYIMCGLEIKDEGIEHDITEDTLGYIEESEKLLGLDLDLKDFEGLMVSTKFNELEYGEDTQINSSGDFLEEENE